MIIPSSLEEARPIHQNEAGYYYPCKYETFRQLRLLHKYYWKAVRQFAEWCRWNAKAPQNRVRREGVYSPGGKRLGHRTLGPWNEPRMGCPIFGRPDYLMNFQKTMPERVDACSLIPSIVRDYNLARGGKTDQGDVGILVLQPGEIKKYAEVLADWLLQHPDQA